MRLPALLLACILMAPAAFAAAPQAGARPDHVADRDCLACHPDQADAWAESKHRHAMQPATAQTVLGDFGEAGSGEVHFGEGAAAARFYRRGGDFMVAAQGPDGRTQALAVSHVFGIRPLQQVLLPQQGGRLQAFTIAWDTTRKAWFSLHADGPVAPGDNLHWSGRYQNWNLMCGECHTTAYRKGYDDEHDRYATTWAEANVGCQACHGAGRAHAESARRRAAAGERGQAPLPTPNRALAGAHAQVDQCATCHARRTRLVEDAVAGAPLFDQFIPDNLRPGLYHADGQQLDEVFEYGSYRQSRMYQAGVACTDCHDPHRGRLRAEGNALCTACHNPAPDRGRFPGLQAKDYDAPSHHFHRGGGAGSQCVDCHMPSRNYMVVHPRRDHAIRVPRPDLGARTGAPDACTGCHADRGAEWAAAAIERHHGKRTHPPHYGEILAAARAGAPGAAAGLAALARDAAVAAIVRASAIEQLAQLDAGAVPAAALRDPDPALRTSAAAAFALRPAEERLAQLAPLLADPVRAVRITAARALADLPATALAPELQDRQRAALAEFVAAQQAMADMPNAQLNLAGLALAQRDALVAEQRLRRALQREPALDSARLGLATLLAQTRREDEAERVLRDGLARATSPGELHLALGLLAGQRQRWEEAARELRAADALLPGHARVRRNLDAVERYLERTRPR
ncbi:cytochrome c3 family protein [Thauera sp. SWB20]|uniref:cytochrome c3 family protein n=1 Tax=Thauera sp. SWB20 TaxID=1572758 RepID=UPI0005ADBEAC|nr:cytochrome c3 family protein [Thauera sp. SWB20]KIN89506.1 class III cytochrome C family protein [Thauera sp. SWB20]